MLKLSDALSQKRLQPTVQQSGLIQASASGKDLVCIARAGSGKTATAVEIAQHLKSSGYFMVFSRAARKDAQSRLPPYVQSVTGHSMAFQRLIMNSHGYHRKLQPELDKTSSRLNMKLVEQTLKLSAYPQWFIASAQGMAMVVMETVKQFQISADRRIEVHHIPENVIPIELRMGRSRKNPALTDFLGEVIDQAQTLWDLMADEHNNFPIQHDTYLKLLQLRQNPMSADLWLLDEYQDTTPVVADLINQQEGQKIYIGDPCQAIYGWRGAFNALDGPIQSGLETHHLTDSFRFNHQIAGLATLLLRSVGERDVVRGQPWELRQLNFQDHHTRLVRNNLTMVNSIAECLQNRQPVYIPGGLTAEVSSKLRSAYALYRDKLDDVSISGLKKLGSWRAFGDFADDQTDNQTEYKTLFNLIEKFGDLTPKLIDYANKPWDKEEDHRQQVTLMTAHRAKGREWPMVALSADLAIPDTTIDRLKAGEALTVTQREQVNLLYVAITRASRGIHLDKKIKKNFADLSAAFSSPDDTTETFVTDPSARAPLPSAPADVRQRTQDFIKRYRKQE